MFIASLFTITDLETIQVSKNRWLYNEVVVYIHKYDSAIKKRIKSCDLLLCDGTIEYHAECSQSKVELTDTEWSLLLWNTKKHSKGIKINDQRQQNLKVDPHNWIYLGGM